MSAVGMQECKQRLDFALFARRRKDDKRQLHLLLRWSCRTSPKSRAHSRCNRMRWRCGGAAEGTARQRPYFDSKPRRSCPRHHADARSVTCATAEEAPVSTTRSPAPSSFSGKSSKTRIAVATELEQCAATARSARTLPPGADPPSPRCREPPPVGTFTSAASGSVAIVRHVPASSPGARTFPITFPGGAAGTARSPGPSSDTPSPLAVTSQSPSLPPTKGNSTPLRWWGGDGEEGCLAGGPGLCCGALGPGAGATGASPPAEDIVRRSAGVHGATSSFTATRPGPGWGGGGGGDFPCRSSSVSTLFGRGRGAWQGAGEAGDLTSPRVFEP